MSKSWTQNEIIKVAGSLADLARSRAMSSDNWATVGELERFSNDLCNAPTRHNVERGAVTYTVKMAVKKLAELRRKTEAL